MSAPDMIGREPITIVEIDQDFCALTYGVAPCTAALGLTGAAKCYNTIASCQDEDNFALGDPLTLRFCTPVEDTGLPKTLTVIPSLRSVSTVPTRINIGGGDPGASPLGQRAKITAEFRDHPYHDRLVDPYADTRGFDPATRGTFWAKFLARNPFYQGRPLRVREGYVGQALAEMDVRHYVIERIDGPSRGVVKVVAKDPLVLLDDDRVKAPRANFGVLLADIDEAAVSLTLSPSGAGAEYAASGTARIGSELVTFTRSGDVITLTGRGLRNSGATTHAAGDLFQEVLVISAQRVDVLLADLMTTYGGIDPGFIPTAAWDAEADLWCSGFTLSAWITEPTGVGRLVSEILDNTGCYVWWDDEAQEVRFRATRPFYPATDVAAIEISDAANVVADSFEMEFRPEERITQVWIYYAQDNPAGAADDPANFGRRRVVVDDDAESALRYGDQRVKRIFARFLDDANDSTTSVVSSRILDRARITPRIIRFDADAKDRAIKTGAIVRLTHRDIVDLTGAATATLLQITSAEQVDPGHRIAFEARPYITRSRYCFVMPNGSPVYGAASAEQKATGGFIAPSAVGFANGDLPYKVL